MQTWRRESSPCVAFKDWADDLRRLGGGRAVPVLHLKTELMIYEDLEEEEEEEDPEEEVDCEVEEGDDEA